MSNGAALWSAGEIERLLTRDRLFSYLQDTGSLAEALQLYAWNTKAATALLQTVDLVEVVLRNAIDTELVAWANRHGEPGTWLDLVPLDRRGAAVLADARARAAPRGQPERHGKVVAELPFGFWRYFTASKYHASLWVPAVHRAFPRGPRDLRARRVRLEKMLQHLVNARNRAAHHEPVHRRYLGYDLHLARTVADWISRDAAAWLMSVSMIPAVNAEAYTGEESPWEMDDEQRQVSEIVDTAEKRYMFWYHDGCKCDPEYDQQDLFDDLDPDETIADCIVRNDVPELLDAVRRLTNPTDQSESPDE